MRHALTDAEWRVISPILPRKPRGVARVDDRRVLNGIFRVLRTGAPWRDLPERDGPYTTCYNHFVRRRCAGVWDHILTAISRHACKMARAKTLDVPAEGLRPKSMPWSTRMTCRSTSPSPAASSIIAWPHALYLKACRAAGWSSLTRPTTRPSYERS